MEVRKGYVEHIVFRNNDNGYTVFQLVSEEEELTCVGLFSVLAEGELVQVSGYMKEHPLYGEQLQVEQYELLAPEDETAMERYLGSGAIKGIGAAMAARIVRRFKGDTFRIIEEEPERLAEVKGISEKKAIEISAQMEEKKDLRQAMMFLTQYGISVPLAVKIYQQYGNRTYQVVEENPYRLADDISGIGFKIADEIASRIGIHTDSDYRIRSGLLYVLLQATGEGHTCLPKEDLLHRASASVRVLSGFLLQKRAAVRRKNRVQQLFFNVLRCWKSRALLRLYLQLLLAVDAAIFAVGAQLKDLIAPFLNGGDAAGVLAPHDVHQTLGRLGFFLTHSLAVFDDGHTDVRVKVGQHIQIQPGSISLHLEDVLAAVLALVAACILDQCHAGGAVARNAQQVHQADSSACLDVVDHDAILDLVNVQHISFPP